MRQYRGFTIKDLLLDLCTQVGTIYKLFITRLNTIFKNL